MKLKNFIKKLNKIVRKEGNSIEVIMADGISVIGPVFSKKYKVPSVVITDQR